MRRLRTPSPLQPREPCGCHRAVHRARHENVSGTGTASGGGGGPRPRVPSIAYHSCRGSCSAACALRLDRAHDRGFRGRRPCRSSARLAPVRDQCRACHVRRRSSYAALRCGCGSCCRVEQHRAARGRVRIRCGVQCRHWTPGRGARAAPSLADWRRAIPWQRGLCACSAQSAGGRRERLATAMQDVAHRLQRQRVCPTSHSASASFSWVSARLSRPICIARALEQTAGTGRAVACTLMSAVAPRGVASRVSLRAAASFEHSLCSSLSHSPCQHRHGCTMAAAW
jgi:hypothetical protein